MRPPPGRTGAGAAVLLSAVVLEFYACLLARQLRDRQGDVSSFVVAGDRYVDRARTPSPITVLQHSPGYDGQFFYRMALDPLQMRDTAFGVTLDNRSSRLMRIGYPLLAWLASLGQRSRVPIALVAVNLACLAWIAWLGVRLVSSWGAPGALGLAFAFYPGFVLSLERDTAEIVATAFGLAALSSALRGRFWRAVPFATFAVLTRETTLFILVGFGIVELVRSVRERRWRSSVVALLIPAVVLFAWQHAIEHMTGASFLGGTGANDLGRPFAGIATFVRTDLASMFRSPLGSDPRRLATYYAVAAGFCCWLWLVPLPVLGRTSIPAGLRLSWLAYAGLGVCFTTGIWTEPYGYLRVFSDCDVVATAMVLRSGSRTLIAALCASTAVVWFMTAQFVLS